MGQYWIPINLDKREHLNPHKLGAGLKLGEQLGSPVADAVLLLCAAMPEPRGGGDPDAAPGVIGRWAGDRIAWIGDYAKDGDLPAEHEASTLYTRCREDNPADGGDPDWADITDIVAPAVEKALGVRFTGTGWMNIEEAG